MRSVRALLALMLVLAVALGTGRPMASAAEMQGGMQASDMVMKGMTSDLSMSGMCDKCIKKDPATHACFVVCIGVQAVLPAMSFLRVSAKAPLDPVVDRLFSGSAGPPDPPPPKANLFA